MSWGAEGSEESITLNERHKNFGHIQKNMKTEIADKQ